MSVENTSHKTKQNKTYLALTADTEYWDLEADKILFLGNWCKTYQNKHIIDSLNYEVMPSPWENTEDMDISRKKAYSSYKNLIPHLADFMNKLHNMNETTKYWEIILGWWFLNFMSIMYYRYCFIKNFKELDIETYTTLKDESDYYTTHDCAEFIAVVFHNDKFVDDFNMDIFSILLSEIKTNTTINRNQPVYPNSYNKTYVRYEYKLPIGKKIKESLFNVANNVTKIIFKSPILLTYTYFPVSSFLFLTKNGKREIVFNKNRKNAPIINANKEKRLNLNIEFNNANEFETIIMKIITKFIPTAYIEGFHELQKLSKRCYPNSYKHIISSTGWYAYDLFCVFVANAQSNGSNLISIQHGGYMLTKDILWPNHELNIVDYLYTWGWSIDYSDAIIKKGAISKLNNSVSLMQNREKILFLNSAVPRYCTDFRYNSLFHDIYYEDQIIFVKNLNTNVFNSLKVRPYGNMNNAIDRYTDEFPNIKIEKIWEPHLQVSLSETRLLIIDHLASTSACEAIALNVPTIFFWRPVFDDFTDISKPIYDKLREVQIFFDSPESAASYINEIYDNIEDWWLEPKRQEAIDAFRNTFAYLPEDSDKWWLDELLSLV
ncbi:MAG: LIC12162 family protein [Oscillospiraceae bacterium]|jgi:putative transferase (TIGR04331 family)|nr:LIC12162 family protein [Oscillospiraceae bacterium]